jgi:predicted HTH domain antitoxin
MTTIQVQLEDDVVLLLRQLNQPAQQAVRELVIMELYRRGTISGGKAAELLGVDRLEFIRRSGQVGIPYFNITKEELEAEFNRSQAP